MMDILSKEKIQKIVFECLGKIAPEIEMNTLNLQIPLREQVELDSLDFIRFLTLLAHTLQAEIPESDYKEFHNLESTVNYLFHKQTANSLCKNAPV